MNLRIATWRVTEVSPESDPVRQNIHDALIRLPNGTVIIARYPNGGQDIYKLAVDDR